MAGGNVPIDRIMDRHPAGFFAGVRHRRWCGGEMAVADSRVRWCAPRRASLAGCSCRRFRCAGRGRARPTASGATVSGPWSTRARSTLPGGYRQEEPVRDPGPGGTGRPARVGTRSPATPGIPEPTGVADPGTDALRGPAADHAGAHPVGTHPPRRRRVLPGPRRRPPGRSCRRPARSRRARPSPTGPAHPGAGSPSPPATSHSAAAYWNQPSRPASLAITVTNTGSVERADPADLHPARRGERRRHPRLLPRR